MTTAQFYRDQAAREQEHADAATLERVRDRSQRAANAWGILADQLARAELGRERRKLEAAPIVALVEPGVHPDRGDSESRRET